MNLWGVARLNQEPALPEADFCPGHYTWHEGRGRYNAFLARTVASLTSGPVLDAGCGVGHFLAALGALGAEAIGFDVSRRAVDEATHRTGAKILQHDANRQWPFADETFNAVTMFDVIEHLVAYERALDEARRVLRPNGLLFIVTVNRASILRWLLGPKWGSLVDPGHVVYFDQRTLKNTLQRHGFRIADSRTFFNFGTSGESAKFLLPLRRPGLIVFTPEFGDSIYVRARKT